jgi:Uncharacterized protein conserved in bacteria
MILDFGKYKGKLLADCDEKYLRWLVTHEKVLAQRNRWAARDAKFILDRKETAVKLAEFEARKEAEMAVKIAQHIVSTPAKVDLAFKGNSNVSRAFSLMR